MIIIQFNNGLGNQMFQYALYKAIENSGYEVKGDVSRAPLYFDGGGNKKLELEHAFGIDIRKASIKEIRGVTKIPTINLPIIKKIANSLYADGEKYFKTNRYENYVYLPTVFEKENIYLEGLWFSEKYFSNIHGQIRQAFEFSRINSENKKLAMDYRNENSVAVHVRVYNREAMNIKTVIRQFGKNVCGFDVGTHCDLLLADYYREAKRYIDQKIGSPVYHIFTNNINWCLENLDFAKKEYVTANQNTTSDFGNQDFLDAQHINFGNNYMDMFLISQCKHSIISNSTFAWWGAWLNNYENKTILCPDRWFSSGYGEGTFPEPWIRIPARGKYMSKR